VTVYAAPLDEIGFVLRHVAGLDEVAALPGLEDATPDVVDALLAEAARLAERVLAPLYAVGDRDPPVLTDGGVRMPPGFREAWRGFAEGGWTSLAFPRLYGGQELPRLVSTATAEIWTAANLSFQNCPLLTQGAVDAILHHGTEAQRELYATRLIRGEWTGAMCLTEPQAGSDVGALRTRAVRDGDRYRIFGGKTFITFGEHDLAANIVHLVLARLDGAPAGTAGISLFIVPKFLPDDQGRPGRRNDLRCVSLERKLGLHASPTCVMAYGDGKGAEGFLLGEENRGIRCMFTMMNNARLAVGHQGLGIAERAYQQALAYARGRIQGARGGHPVPIAEHPDVRRMLLTMRAQIAAMRALAYWTAAFVDRGDRHPDPASRAAAADRVALLTPLVKAWLADLGYEIASQAVLVHGGVGYVEETGAAQHLRDARILAIYEGTNGIQAMDLVGRKLELARGEVIRRLIEELRAELPRLPSDLTPDLALALAAVERTTSLLRARPADDRASAAAPYLRLLATTLGAFLLARGAAAASGGDRDWPRLARFFARALLPPALAGEAQIAGGVALLDAGPAIA
jgi:3-(methylthio)propanoyl-CoA dehydrogenase